MTSENHSTLTSSKPVTLNSPTTFDLMANATGPVTIPMTNDYLFRALLQRNNKVLKGLISSLLHLPVSQIISVEIMNPIELGKSIAEKDFILDIKVLLNNNTIINLEMQVVHEHNWIDRSLSYLCRLFDQLTPGDDYTQVKPVRQIGFLDFTPFPEVPEFYATYKMMNVKNHVLYSDKFALSVVNLKCINLATEEDKQYQIDHWASLFKANTWEEIKLLTEQNEYIKEASTTVYQLSQEEAIRQQCEAREEYYRRQRTMQYYVDKATADLAAAEQRAEEAERHAEEAERHAEEAERHAEEAERHAEEAERHAEEAEQRALAAELQLAEALAKLASLNTP